MIEKMAKDAKAASSLLRKVERGEKDAVLKLMARRLGKRKEDIQKENKKDLSLAKEKGLSSAAAPRR